MLTVICRQNILRTITIKEVSSVSGPYSAIDPYVKPVFPPDPPQMTALYEFLSYCLRVFHVLITLSRYDFSFNHVFSCSFNFFMAICSYW